MIEFNINSPEHLSCLFFGGILTEEVKEPEVDALGNYVLYGKGAQKEGQIKYRNKEKQIKITGLGIDPKIVSRPLAKAGLYSVDEEVLLKIANLPRLTEKAKEAVEISKTILRQKKIEKQIGTYYDATEQLVDEMGFTHPNYHHTKTGTGRLSSSNINAQNQPKPPSKVTQHFCSRFVNGSFISVDFSQLEVCIQADISGDNKYINDIIDGMDFHVKKLALKENMHYLDVYNKCKVEKDPLWIKKRSDIKEFTFQRNYAAGAASISEATGIPIKEIQELIRLEEMDYAQLKSFNNNLIETVKKNKEGGYGWYGSPTGRRYYFKEEIAPVWLQRRTGEETSFSPTKIKNYIVQGFATADIVPIMLGVLWRECIKHRDKFLLINTVHDSIIFDCKPEYVTFCKKIISSTLDKTAEVVYNKFNYALKVPLKYDIKQGKNWYEVLEQ